MILTRPEELHRSRRQSQHGGRPAVCQVVEMGAEAGSRVTPPPAHRELKTDLLKV